MSFYVQEGPHFLFLIDESISPVCVAPRIENGQNHDDAVEFVDLK